MRARGEEAAEQDEERIEIVTGGSQVSASSTLSPRLPFDVTVDT